MKAAKQRTYDDIYGHADSRYDTQRGFLALLRNRLSKLELNRYRACYDLLPSQGCRLLDVGCGSGDFVFIARKRFESCYGVDVSSARIGQAISTAHRLGDGSSVHFRIHDVDEGLPFNSAFFDVVTCIAVLEHVFNPPAVLNAIRRVLRPGGTLILSVPNIAWLPYRLQLLFGRLPTSGGVYLGTDWEHLHSFTKSSICYLLRQKRFEIKNVICSGVFARIRSLWISLLGGDLIVKSERI